MPFAYENSSEIWDTPCELTPSWDDHVSGRFQHAPGLQMASDLGKSGPRGATSHQKRLPRAPHTPGPMSNDPCSFLGQAIISFFCGERRGVFDMQTAHVRTSGWTGEVDRGSFFGALTQRAKRGNWAWALTCENPGSRGVSGVRLQGRWVPSFPSTRTMPSRWGAVSLARWAQGKCGDVEGPRPRALGPLVRLPFCHVAVQGPRLTIDAEAPLQCCSGRARGRRSAERLLSSWGTDEAETASMGRLAPSIPPAMLPHELRPRNESADFLLTTYTFGLQLTSFAITTSYSEGGTRSRLSHINTPPNGAFSNKAL